MARIASAAAEAVVVLLRIAPVQTLVVR